MRRRRFPFSSTWPCRLNRSKSRLRLPATCLLRSMSYLFKPMPTARPAVSDPISLNTLSIVHLLTWAYLLFVSDKNLNVSISGDVDEAKALSKPPDDSQGTMTTMFFCPTLNAIAAPLWDSNGMCSPQMTRATLTLRRSKKKRSVLNVFVGTRQYITISIDILI